MRRHIIASTEQVSFYTAYFKPTSIIILKAKHFDRHDVTMPTIPYKYVSRCAGIPGIAPFAFNNVWLETGTD